MSVQLMYCERNYTPRVVLESRITADICCSLHTPSLSCHLEAVAVYESIGMSLLQASSGTHSRPLPPS